MRMIRKNEMKFWQKIYLICLTLFLIIVCVVLVFIGWQSQEQLTNLEVREAQTAHYHIKEALEKDLAFLEDNKTVSLEMLFDSYSKYYRQENKLLELRKSGKIINSNLPKYDGKRKELEIKENSQNWVIRTIDDQSYLYITGKVTSGKDVYLLTLAKSLTGTAKMWQKMQMIYIIASLCAAIVLGILLYIILKRMFSPLADLEKTAANFSSGDFTARAEIKSKDEVGRLTESFNDMADSAEKRIIENKRIADKNEFMAASLSHEIRTPLTTIKGYSEYIKLAPLSDEEKMDALDHIINESDRLQKLSEKVLDLFKLNHETIHFEQLDLACTIEEAVSSLDHRQIMVTVDISAPIHSLGDPTLLNRLFVNLLDNSIKACSGEGEVTITAQLNDDVTKICISDTGKGMTPSELEKIGEPFYRPDRSRNSQNGGNGLGIAICYQIVSIHDWQIAYFSEKGKGTQVELSFTTP